MSDNTSDPQLSLNSSLNQMTCLKTRPIIYTFSAISITYILLLPFFLLVLYLGLQSWRRQRSSSTNTSHSDVITCHAIIMQLHEFFGFMLFFAGLQCDNKIMFQVGVYLSQTPFIGKALFHLLACLERYLAVVHPIIYLALKKPWGVRIRNITIGFVWLVSFAWLVLLSQIKADSFNLINICHAVFYLCVLSLLSVVILCTLKHPGPGKVRIDKSKQRAFNTIAGIMVVLLMRFGSILTVFVILEIYSIEDVCAVTVGLGVLLEVPSSLVLPLLFLHRAGKLQCCK